MKHWLQRFFLAPIALFCHGTTTLLHIHSSHCQSTIVWSSSRNWILDHTLCHKTMHALELLDSNRVSAHQIPCHRGLQAGVANLRWLFRTVFSSCQLVSGRNLGHNIPDADKCFLFLQTVYRELFHSKVEDALTRNAVSCFQNKFTIISSKCKHFW